MNDRGNHITPPKWALRFLRFFIKKDYLEEIEGDMEEVFQDSLETYSPQKARVHYTWQVLKLFRSNIIKKPWSTHSNFLIMLNHYLLIAFRNFKRYKSTIFINLTGLSTGLACVLFIYLWVADEMAMDQFHVNNKSLYQVMSNHTNANGIETWKGVPGLLLDEIQASVPEVAKSVAFTDAHEYTLTTDELSLKANGKFAGEDFFEVFTYGLVAGNPGTALSDKNGIVITESLAEKLFQTKDAVGKLMEWHYWDKQKTLEVRGIMKDLPPQASEKFDFLMNWDYFHDELITYKNWTNYYGRVAVVLNPSSDISLVEKKIDQILQENQNSDDVTLFLTRFSDMYLKSKYEQGIQAGGRIDYVNLFSIVAVFILLIASINFINLSTACASQRTKEIGVKKSIGASKISLMGQYFTESVLLSTMSMILGLVFVFVLLPQFNFLTQKDLELAFSWQLIVAMACILFVVGLLAGSYPALYLSGFNVVKAIKGNVASRGGEIWGRKILVVVQFTLSIILIVGVGVVHFQMDFVRNKNLGYDRDNLVYFEREGKLLADSKAFVKELQKLPGIKNAAQSGFMVGGGNSTGGVSWPGKTKEDQVQFWEIRSGYETLDLIDIKLLEGRDFSEAFITDKDAAIVNESALKAMNMTDPIGKTIRHYEGEKMIIGVVKDFNLTSLHSQVAPTIFLCTPEKTHFIMAKLSKEMGSQVLDNIEDLYSDFNAGYPFQPRFLDQDYQALYASEDRVASLSKYFAVLAILISCLGLFGLAAHTTERRVKEIGIRKVLGSGVWKIVYLLTADFTKMVLAAIVIAIPFSYYIGNNWLENFAYKIHLGWSFFAGAALLSIAIAWLTVSFQTLRAAMANPVKCLKDD
ncbi:MAG: ABC transporter permease [Cyclobacteriaceae bacterium]